MFRILDGPMLLPSARGKMCNFIARLMGPTQSYGFTYLIMKFSVVIIVSCVTLGEFPFIR